MADVNQLLHKASQLYQKGRLKDAKKTYQKLIKLSPKLIEARNMYGITLAQLNELPSAALQFEKIIQIDSKNTSAYENIARVYMQMEQFSRAQTFLEKAVAIDPDSYVFHFSLGGALMSQTQFELALASFSKAQEINNTQPLLFINLGTVLSQLNRYKDAADAFQQAIALDPSSAHAMLRFGQMLLHENKFTQAEVILIKAQQLQQTNFEANLSLADAYQNNAKDELAIQYYLIADRLKPKSQNVYTKLDKLLLFSGVEEKKTILKRLTEEKVYDDWTEATVYAEQLCKLSKYDDENTLLALQQFLEEYNPEDLHAREWWKKYLNAFGDDQFGHDKMLRGIHSAVFSWSIPDKQTLSSIADFVKGTRLYSYGAGSALWERLLSDHFGIEVLATDFEPRHSFLPIQVEDYFKAIVPEHDTIFLSWIIRGDTGILNILKQLKAGQKLILIGEPPDVHDVPRICGSIEMFAFLDKEYTLNQTIPLVSFSMINDTVSLYIKN